MVRRRRDQSDPRGSATVERNVFGHFAAWQLPPFSWLSPLRHLDLDLIRVGEVVGSHTETTTGYLFDRTAESK